MIEDGKISKNFSTAAEIIYDLKENSEKDAEEGFTPGFMRGTISVKLNNSAIFQNEIGGTYIVNVDINNATKSTSQVFVYSENTDTLPTILETGSTAIYKPYDNLTYISGIGYESGGEVSLTVGDISNTHYMVTKDLKRIHVSDTSNQVSFTENPPIITTVNGIISSNYIKKDTDLVNETATFTWNETVQASSQTPSIVSGNITIKPYGQEGTTVGNGITIPIVRHEDYEEERYLYTQKETINYNSDNFSGETNRLLGYFDGSKLILETPSNYNSEESISDSNLASYYNKQALVQGNYLKHPKNDITGQYTDNATGTRYFIREIKMPSGNDQKEIVTINVKSGINALGNESSPIKIYAVNKDDLSRFVRLDAPTNILNGVADKNFKNGTWTCQIPTNKIKIYQNKGFYLVIEMSENAASLGPITLTF